MSRCDCFYVWCVVTSDQSGLCLAACSTGVCVHICVCVCACVCVCKCVCVCACTHTQNEYSLVFFLPFFEHRSHIVLQSVAVCRDMLQCVAVCCSVL